MRTLLQLMTFLVCLMHHVESAENDCGNTSFSGSAGIVTSPNFPLPYSHNLSCTYSIDVGRNNSALLKFLNFDLESPFAGTCQYDWIMITCNETDDENLDFRKKYCGTSLPRTSLWFFNCPVVNLEFFADSSVNGGGFSIAYTVFDNANLTHERPITDLACGQTVFSGSSGVIRLPTNPTDYQSRVDCIYTISTNLPSQISIDISAFQRTQLLDSFEDCDRDNITIGCELEGQTGPNPRSRNTYCRRLFYAAFIQPSSIIFPNCRMVKISIRSSDFYYREAHGIPFAVSPYDIACGTTSFTDKTGIVTSPQFPLSYQHNLNCVYSIDVDRTKTVSLNFSSFHLEGVSRSSFECRFDWLTVTCSTHGSALVDSRANMKYCGLKTMPMTLNYSRCDSLTLNFVSDESINNGGFKLRYTIASAGQTANPKTGDGCGNTSFTGPVGFISSPRFPLPYPNNLNCVYSLDVDPTKIVVLRFLSFNIEGDSHPSHLDNCKHDWLMISCLRNSSVSTSAFRYSNIRYCGAKTTPYTFIDRSNCDSLTLNFVTDSSITSGGFQLRYRISSLEDCGDTSFSGPNGTITSPHYPFQYSHNMSCKFSIDVGRNNSVLLKFMHFYLEEPNSTNHCKDWLMISCNETTRVNPNYDRKYCGSIQWTSSMRFVDCSSLVLEFVSDSSINSEGFVIEYTVVDSSSSTDDNADLDCGTTSFNSSSGVISLPRNSKNYLATVNCTYSIAANGMSYIHFNASLYPSMPLFQSFDACTTDNLTIECSSEDETSFNPNRTIVLCRRGTSTFSYTPTSFAFADCRTLKLSIQSTNYDNQETFRIPFSVYGQNEICGNTSYFAPSGIISSRQLPFNLQTSLSCVYAIDSGHANSVVLVLDRLSFGHTGLYDAPCNDGWLMISCMLNGTSVPHPLANRKLCKISDVTAMRFPACRSVLLNYSSDFISISRGFSLRYRIGDHDPQCGNTSYSGPSGFITSPMFPLSYPINLNCMYSITGGKRNAISLSFLSFRIGVADWYLRNSCDGDWMTVSCLSGQSVDGNILSSRRYCGNENTGLAFPSCGVVVLNFQSDSRAISRSLQPEGFRVRYTVIDKDAECGNTSFSGPNGFITSPMFPQSYPHDLNCMYSISGGLRKTISLSFSSFSIQGTSNMPLVDYCTRDWLTIGCSSDKSATANNSSSRKYCGVKASPLIFTFPNCEAVALNFWSDSSVAGRGFHVRYTVVDKDSFCGSPVYGPPSGVISIPLNSTDYADSIDCSYIINNTEPSSISLTIWSINLQSSEGGNCQSVWLLINCVSGYTTLDHKVSHSSCDNLTSSTQLIFLSCAAAKVVYHRESGPARKSFHIEYAVTSHEMVRPDMSTTSVPTTLWTVETGSSCATGCEMSSDATYCECITTQPTTATKTFTSEVPISVQTTSDPIHQVITTVTNSDAIQSDSTTTTSEVPITVQTTSDALHTATTTVSSDVPVTVRTTIDVIQPTTTTISSSVPSTSGAIESETTASTSDKFVSQTTKCDVRCSETRTGDRLTCNCPSTQSDDDLGPRSTQLPTTSISPTQPVTSETSCATGCKLSANATYCECLPVEDTSHPSSTAISASTEILLIEKCDVGCTASVDGGSCDCSTKQPGDAVVYSNLYSSGERGRAVGISLTVILVVAGAICVGAVLLFRRHRKKSRSEMLLRKSEVEEHQLELVDDPTSEPGFRNEDRGTSRYLPLMPVSIRDHVESSSSRNSPQT